MPSPRVGSAYEAIVLASFPMARSWEEEDKGGGVGTDGFLGL